MYKRRGDSLAAFVRHVPVYLCHSEEHSDEESVIPMQSKRILRLRIYDIRIGMLATGKHWDFDSLRGAPRSE